MDVIERYEGDFWIPEAPDRKLAGECHIYDSGRIELRLHGTFEPTSGGIDFSGHNRYPRVVGHTGIQLLALEECTPTNETNLTIDLTGHGPLVRKTMLVRRLYHGLKVPEEGSPRFNKVAIEVTDLQLISGMQVIRQRRFLNDEKTGLSNRIEISVETGTLGPERFQDGAIEILSLCDLKSLDTGERILHPKNAVVINFESPRTASDIERCADRLRDTVALATGRACDIVSVTLYSDDATIETDEGDRQVPINYYWRRTRSTSTPIEEQTSRIMQPLFDLPGIGGVGALGRLLTVLERQEFANARIMSTVHHPSQFIEEKAGRRLFPLESLFNKCSRPKPAWPKDFNKKLIALVEIAGKPMSELLGGYTESWTKAAKAARDLEGHGDLDKDGHQYQNLDLHADLALWLYTMVVLREADVPDTAFATLVANSRYEQLRARLVKHAWFGAQIEVDAAVFARLRGGTASVHVDRARNEYQNLVAGDALCFRHQGELHLARVGDRPKELLRSDLGSANAASELGHLHAETVAAAGLLPNVKNLRIIPLLPL